MSRRSPTADFVTWRDRKLNKRTHVSAKVETCFNSSSCAALKAVRAEHITDSYVSDEALAKVLVVYAYLNSVPDVIGQLRSKQYSP